MKFLAISISLLLGCNILSQNLDQQLYIDMQELECYEDSIDQHISDSIHENEVYGFVEEMPEFPGGSAAMFQYLSENIKYSDIKKGGEISSKVVLKFVVQKEGTIGDVNIIYGKNDIANKEVIRVFKSMPKWKPGKQRGKLVDVWYTIPITVCYR